MNFLPLYRGPAAVTVTVATLAALVVMKINAAKKRKEAERKTVKELSTEFTDEILMQLLEWDESQFKRNQEKVLSAVQTALTGDALSKVRALKVLSLKNCPRQWLEECLHEVLPLLKDLKDAKGWKEKALVKYMAIYAFYSNLRLASAHIKAIEKVVYNFHYDYYPIINRVTSYVQRFNEINKELEEKFAVNLSFAQRKGDVSWVEWAMTWVWNPFDEDVLDYTVHFCWRLLDDAYVGKCWLELTNTLIDHHRKALIDRKAPWLIKLGKHMFFVKMCANQVCKELANVVLTILNAEKTFRQLRIDISHVLENPRILGWGGLPIDHPNLVTALYREFSQ
jgi:hypothetical protein